MLAYGGFTDQDMNNMWMDQITESQSVVKGIVWVCRISYKIRSEPSWVNTALIVVQYKLFLRSCYCYHPRTYKVPELPLALLVLAYKDESSDTEV